MNKTVSMNGRVQAKVHRAPGPGLGWKIRNMTRPSYVWGKLVNALARAFTALTGIPTLTAELSAVVVRADGRVVRYGVLSRRVVTSAGVAFLVDDWDTGTTEISNMNYHATGTGTTAEASADTALVAEVGTREAGTKSQPAANQLQTVATVNYTGTNDIAEHGLFSASSTGTLWDRSVFTAIPVANGDSITFTYTCTLNAGG